MVWCRNAPREKLIERAGLAQRQAADATKCGRPLRAPGGGSCWAAESSVGAVLKCPFDQSRRIAAPLNVRIRWPSRTRPCGILRGEALNTARRAPCANAFRESAGAP